MGGKHPLQKWRAITKIVTSSNNETPHQHQNACFKILFDNTGQGYAKTL